MRDKATIKRLQMYRNFKAKRYRICQEDYITLYNIYNIYMCMQLALQQQQAAAAAAAAAASSSKQQQASSSTDASMMSPPSRQCLFVF